MIDADLSVALAQKFLGDEPSLIDSLLDAGQRTLVDAPLIGLQARHMGVAVAGDAIRRQRRHDLAGLAERGDGLQRQAVDQVEIQVLMPAARNRATAASTSCIGCQRPIAACTSGLTSCTPRLARLTPSFLQALRQMPRYISRIELDGVFVTGFKDEAVCAEPA